MGPKLQFPYSLTISVSTIIQPPLHILMLHYKTPTLWSSRMIICVLCQLHPVIKQATCWRRLLLSINLSKQLRSLKRLQKDIKADSVRNLGVLYVLLFNYFLTEIKEYVVEVFWSLNMIKFRRKKNIKANYNKRK